MWKPLAGQNVHFRMYGLVVISVFIDFSRAPNAREAAAIRRRMERLDAMQGSVRASSKHLQAMRGGRRPDDRLWFRDGYSCLPQPAAKGGSDRVLPPRELRPPITRLTSPRGAALRLHLVALGVAQFQGRPGRLAKNPYPLRPWSGTEVGWTDLLASPAVAKGDGRVLMTAQDKRVRQLHSALDALEAASLVWLPRKSAGAGKYEGFELLEETGARAADEDPIPYRIPKTGESTFWLPDTFVSSGWVHVLEDSEIALLCMTACRKHSIETTSVAVPAYERVQHYGIGRDGFEAHLWLERFGLLEVTSVGRHSDDGRSVDYADEGSSLHRLQLNVDGFPADGFTTVKGALDHQLARV